jgi:hypothetical protein
MLAEINSLSNLDTNLKDEFNSLSKEDKEIINSKKLQKKKFISTNSQVLTTKNIFETDELTKISNFILLIKKKALSLHSNIFLLLGIKKRGYQNDSFTSKDFSIMEQIDNLFKQNKNNKSFLNILQLIVDTLSIIQYNLHIVIYTIYSFNDVISIIDHAIASINERMYLIFVELEKISNEIDIYL